LTDWCCAARALITEKMVVGRELNIAFSGLDGGMAGVTMVQEGKR
jgi:hypothetical protein